MTITTVKPTRPSSGLGNPRTDACGVTITDPHDTTGLMLHVGTYDGLRSSSIFSTVSVIEAARPITPAMSTHHALGAGTPATATRIRCLAAVLGGLCGHAGGRHAAGATAVSMPGTSPTIDLILPTSASGVDGS